MPRTVPDALTEPVLRILKGAIDVGDGGTDEQRSVLRAVAVGFLGRRDLDLDALEPLDPDAGAAAVADPEARGRVQEMLVLLESSRHPLTDEQVARIDAYGAPLGGTDDAGLTVARDLVREGAARAIADYQRFVEDIYAEVAEPSLKADHLGKDDHDPALAEHLRSFHDLPEGTLGRAYVAFYDRNHLTYPGDDPNTPAVFVAHDMTHVIAGYEPTGPGEIALGAFLLAMNDTHAHWIGFLGNLAIHEAGYFDTQGFVGKTGTLARPGASDTLTEAFERGEQCTGDFSTVDHLAMVDRPLADVRAEFGVPPVVHDR